MTARIYNADEARALLDEASLGPWASRLALEHDLHAVVFCARDPDNLGPDIAAVYDTGSYCDRHDAALLAAAPDLAASVKHHAARADALAADLHRVTMERDGARLSLDAAQAARVKQSLELAEARAEVVRLNARVAELESLAAGPRRRVPSLCHDCRGDGVINDAECGACGGEGCRS